MKKIRTILATTAIALTLGSCSEEEILQNDGQSGMPISFSLQDKLQKGISTDNTTLTNFGITAFLTEANSWKDNPKEYPDLMYNTQVTGEVGKTWTYSPLVTWPSNDKHMVSFFAYAPYETKDNGIVPAANTAEGTPTITFTVAEDAEKMVDFVATTVLDKTYSNSEEGTVNFKFKHELTRLNLSARVTGDAADKNIYFVIKEVVLGKSKATNLHRSAVYTFSDEADKPGTWSDSEGTLSNYNLKNVLNLNATTAIEGYKENGIFINSSTPTTLLEDKKYLFFIPVVGGVGKGDIDVYVKYDKITSNEKLAAGYSIEKDQEGTLEFPAGILQQGKAHNLTFTFSANGIQVDANAGNDYIIEANNIKAANEAFAKGTTSVEIDEIGAESVIKLPTTESEVNITLLNGTDIPLSIQYADDEVAQARGTTLYPTVLNLTVYNGQEVGEMTFDNLTHTTVNVNGKLAKAIASSKALNLNEGTVVGELVINTGDVCVKTGAEVTTILERTGDVEDSEIKIYVENGATVPEELPKGFEEVDAEVNSFYETLQEGGNVEVTKEIADDVTEIDFNGLTIANDLKLMINAPIKTLKLGGNTDGKNIIVEIANGVAYPEITLQSTVKNYTIKGDAKTTAPLSNNFINHNASIDNFIIDGIKADENVEFAFVGAQNLTIKNCMAVDHNPNNTFIYLDRCNNAQILNNTISYLSLSEKIEYHGISIFEAYGNILVEENDISNSNKHGLMLNWGNDAKVVVRNNVFNGVGEDGIKADYSRNIKITGNTIKASEYGIRLDRLHEGTATFVIEKNKISTPCNKGAYGILINNRESKTVTVDLTVNNNTVDGEGIKQGYYFHTTGNGMTLTGDYDFPYTIVKNSHYITCKNEHGLKDFAAMKWMADEVNSGKNTFAGITVKLLDDIDMAGQEWTPINGWNGILNGTVIDGGGHTISNMSIKGTGTDGFIGANASSLTIKNLTFYKAIVNDKNGGNTRYAGVVIGKNYSSVTIENVHVTNSVVINNWQSGGLVGFAEGNAPVFTNCSISDSFVGGSNATAGSFFGLGAVDVTLTKCTATNINLYTDMEAGFVGYLYGKTLTATDCTRTNVTVVAEYPEGY